MINKNLLKSKMALKGVLQKDLSKILDISIPSMTQKTNGNIKFKPAEISKIKDVLSLTNDEVVEIFLS